jgi:DTW domain-containing protein
MKPSDSDKQAEHSTKCAVCWKGPELCLCNDIQPSKTKTKVLILQHPQEARNPWGTARLTSLALSNSVHKVGLSWRSLSKALGEPAEPSKWGVLFLGAMKDKQDRPSNKPFQILSSEGRSVAPQKLEGIILLDGNWKQSKTLWWRNPWLTRLNRIVLNPGVPSVFNRISRQPRKDCLCTLESARHTLAALEKNHEAFVRLDELLKKHVEKVELVRPAVRPSGPTRRAAPRPPRKPSEPSQTAAN